MIRVQRGDPADAEWQTWWANANAAMNALVNQYNPGADIVLDDQFYQTAKPFLLKLFNGKCAYCETVISANQPGDVEHYRPKGRIRTRAGVVTIMINGREVEHPGYWWLAYHWKNLLPSCIDCNRRRRHEDQGMAGKADYFEIRGSRAVAPDDNLRAEQALLLDPTADDFNPEAHFEFKADGTIKPLTEDAQYSCDLLGLNLRETLVRERAKAYYAAKQAFVTFMTLTSAVSIGAAPPEVLAPAGQQINDMWEGRSGYSAFAHTALLACSDQVFRNTGIPVTFPLKLMK